MDNLESIIDDLEKFDKKIGDGTSKALQEYMQYVAKTGDTVFPWHRIRHFMRHMLATVMNEFFENCGGEDMSECGNIPAFSFTTTRDKLLHHFDTFNGAPFTIQRLCEIMVDPTRHYKRTDKFLRGLEKNVLVVSNIEPGRQRRCEDIQQTLVNGLQDSPLHTSVSITSPLLTHTKRLSLTQTTNSITNNTSDSYNSEIHDTENMVTGSEANGPSGMHRDELSRDLFTDNTEPPAKKAKTNGRSFNEEKLAESTELLGPQLEEKSSSFMPHDEAESMEAEASEDSGGSVVSKSSSSSAKVVEATEESREAEATSCQAAKNAVREIKTPSEMLGQQVGTSEVTTQDTAAHLEEEARLLKVEDSGGNGEALSRSPEVCSSNSPQRGASQKVEQNEKLCLSSASVTTKSSEECPDSVEGTTELVCEEEEQTQGAQKDEQEASSEATAAAADQDSQNEAVDDVSEGLSLPDNKSSDSHEADSTSQAHNSHSSSTSSQPATSGLGTTSSTASLVSSPSSTDSSSTAAPTPSTPSVSPSPPDATTAHTTTSQTPSVSSTPPAVSASTSSSTPQSSPNPSAENGAAAASTSTSSSPSESADRQEPTDVSSESPSVESNSTSEKEIVSGNCSSSQPNESDVKQQPTEEE